MPRHIAFLRGINLGGRRLSMDRLRSHFEDLGLANVATFIASGNVIFDATVGNPMSADGTAGVGAADSANAAAFASAAELEARIEAHLAGALGYDVDTFIRSIAELEAVARAESVPIEEDGGWKPHVIFLRDAVGDDVARRLRGLETDDDRFPVYGREVYWLRRGRLSDSSISTSDLARALGGATNTMRTLNTVRRIVAKFARPARVESRQCPP